MVDARRARDKTLSDPQLALGEVLLRCAIECQFDFHIDLLHQDLIYIMYYSLVKNIDSMIILPLEKNTLRAKQKVIVAHI